MRDIIRKFVGFGAVLLVFSCPAAWAGAATSGPQDPAIGQQVEDIRDQVEIISDSVENVEESLSKMVNVSGYMDAEYILDDRKDKPDGFRVHHFSLFLEKKVSHKWSVFSELEFEDAPYIQANSPESITAAQGKILLEQMYTDYHHSPLVSFRAGRYLTPAGIWNINHYPPFVTTQSRPLHIRSIFPQYLDGLQVHGDFHVSDFMLSYMAYAANGEGTSGGGDNNDDKAVGGRLELVAPFLVEIKMGVSALSDKLGDGTSKSAAGADVQFRLYRFKIQAEYAQASMKPVAGETYRSTGYYVQAQTDIGRWTIFARHDFYNPDDSVKDNGTTVNTGGVNYHWTPTVVSKIEGNIYDFKSEAYGPGYTSWIVSLALFF